MIGLRLYHEQESVMKKQNSMCNAMSVDVEDYFQVSAFEKHIDKSDWNRIPCRVEENIERILALFDQK